MLKLYFYFSPFFLKIQSCEKSVKYKSSGEKPKLKNYAICFMLSVIIVEIFYENCQN